MCDYFTLVTRAAFSRSRGRLTLLPVTLPDAEPGRTRTDDSRLIESPQQTDDGW